MAAAYSVGPQAWLAEFEVAFEQVAARFARRDARGAARDLLAGLVAPLERKNCWTIAEHAGHESPHRLQHLLGRAVWDANAVRDDVRDYVRARLADSEAVLVVDETGDLKKGTKSVGVQRQYTGTAGRVENAQVAVFLTYAAQRGHTFIDRRLYLPESWASDPDRRHEAGVPDEAGFATKPHLAAQMITDALAAGTPARWVAGDEVYGADPHLRSTCRRLGLGYVLAIGCNRAVATGAGPLRADKATSLVPTDAWARMSCGDGSKGRRWYSWAVLELEPEPDGPDLGSGHHALLVRRNDTTGELAWYRCWTPRHVAIGDLVHVAGRRWTVEENFQAAKSHAGLDEHQVRRWDSWHRWTTLAMLGHALLTVLAVTMNDVEPIDDAAGLIAVTVGEGRRLFAALVATVSTTIERVLAWSRWRRRRQHRARRAHYQRREGSITAAHRPDLRL
ncbi:IS701 family transposase [Promicromonospora umidemergens]|uniref:IS701 family transposase n=1 Tax=Promicromonospora umidemergens TaxID=629679 RepID=UPI003CD07133